MEGRCNPVHGGPGTEPRIAAQLKACGLEITDESAPTMSQAEQYMWTRSVAGRIMGYAAEDACN